MDYTEACCLTVSKDQAIAEIKKHGCTSAEFFADNGNHSDYDGGEVLAWLGY